MTRWRKEVAILLLLAAVVMSALANTTVSIGRALADDDRGAVSVTPTQLTFQAVVNGPAPPPQLINVTASTATPFTASASVQSGGTHWLSISPSGTLFTNQTIRVSANPTGLPSGTFHGTVAIRARETTTLVAVTFIISTAVNFQVSPTSLTFSANVAGSAPAPQSVSVTANTPTSFTASASVQSGSTNWLSTSPSGTLTTNRTIAVSANPAGLAAGTYNGTITITGGGVTILVAVTFDLSSTGGTGITVTPAQLTFSATAGGSAPAAQSISVTASSATSFTASAAAQTGAWLTISPSGSLTTNQIISVSANPTGLAAGTYSGTVTISGGGTTHTVAVSFVISSSVTGGFTLIGWNDLGMHCDDGKDYSVFGLLPPYNDLHAQLINKSGSLVVNPAGYKITYQGIHDLLTNTINTISSPKSNWWTYAGGLVAPLGFPPPSLDAGLAPVGVSGFAMPGLSNTPQTMLFSTTDNTWVATGLPVVPYGDAAAPPYPHNDYPMMQLTATDSSGNVLATTNIVVPVSDDIGCATCHGSTSGYVAAMPASGWSNMADPDKDMKHNILKKHDDRFAATTVFKTAAAAVGYSTAGLDPTTATKPVLCINCHAEVFLGLSGQPGVQAFSLAMHGLHGSAIDPATNQTLDSGATRSTCHRCHPGSSSQCLRGVMGNLTDSSGAHLIECQSCHGNLSNLATATRKPWFDEPNCQACHTGTAVTNSGQIVYNSVFSSGTTMRVAADQTFATNPNTPATGESLFRFSSGHGGLQCESCHGPTHAEYPTSNVNDNVQSTNLQGHTGVLAECTTCHATVPSTVTGGPHGLHPVGSTWVSQHPGVVESSGATQCQVCHGTDYRGTILSKTLANRTLAGHTFPAGTIISCYSCHNGPGGG